MDKSLKQKYSKLAVEMDLSFAQLIRYALRKLDEQTK